jgi:hypothetical protein
MKNNARKNINKNAKKKDGVDYANEVRKQKARSKERDVLYCVKTKRDASILKAYITFTYRVYHPGVTARLLFFGVLIAAPSIIIAQTWLRILCLAAGSILILLGLFRQYISLAITKNSDEDYRNGTIFAYEFTQNDAAFYRDGEMISYSRNYKDIDAIFYDENYYYISYKNREFFVIPMDKFTIGDPATFDDFMYKKCKKVCHWIPVKFSNKIKKIRSQRAIAREQMKK